MCGINGVIFKSNTNESSVKQQLTVMNNLIIHRGPDDDGVFAANNSNNSVGMAMRRLSIIDLSSGNQPMFSEDKSITIVFNGEIYNYKTLKSQLLQEGARFHTQSDTEVILKLYETYGTDGFQQLDGMFGFSIYDAKKQKVFIARDFFGEKPMYYTHTDNQFLWASELKSIINCLPSKPEISLDGLNLYFRLTYIPAPYTIYESIHKLEPNSFISYDLNTFEFDIQTIHDNKPIKKQHITFEDAKKQVKNKVIKSVESRSISDVPLGTFLSGGVDSSVVSYCLATMSDSKIDTFSIGFEKASYDETDKSRVVANLIHSNHHEFIISESDLAHNIDAILLNFDEPFADSSSLPTYLVSSKTKAHVKVALTGDGGDEVFGGYNKYYIGKLNSRYTSIVPQILHKNIHKISNGLLKQKDDARGFKYKLNKLLNAINYTDSYYWDIISLGFDTKDINEQLLTKYQKQNLFDYYKTKSNISNPKTLNDFMTIDRHMSLEGDMLVKVDRTSMLNSLECRAPFLNRELFEYTMSLPEDFLLHKWSKKHILKEAFKNEFPEGFLEKSKHGFGVPVGDWLRNGLKNELLSYIEPHFLNQQNIFNEDAISELVQNHVDGKKDSTFKVWAFFCFQKWYLNTYKS
uniref:asparagine synthase (glutamine-hydrolyzing) n=1 Tax=Gelidibacter sp. TaxID=2018083 RepID=UPI0040497843